MKHLRALFTLLFVSTVMAEPKVIERNVVCAKTAIGDGGNRWGGHQGRIVRTKHGIFTAYTLPGKGDFLREFRLVQLQGKSWKVIAEGVSGKDPVNLLCGPDGTLYILGWPDQLGTLWFGKPANGQIKLKKMTFPSPKLVKHNWPYASAGIDLKGNLCLLSSEGEKPHTPKFRLAFLSAKEKKWTFKEMVLPHRHCYSYVFPLGPSSLKLVSTRDVRWHEIGLKKTPRGAPHGFSFNAFRSWYIEDVLKPEFKEQHFIEEKGTTDFPFSFCNAQNDSYIDSKGRLHILYRVEGERTKGREQRFHLMLSASGEKLKEARIPDAAGVYCRIIEDDRGNFYILGSGGKRKGDGFTAGKAVIYEAGKDGFKTDKAIPLDLGSEKVEYSGFALACPRNGTALGQNLDLVFPSGPQGIKWNYCRIKLYSD